MNVNPYSGNPMLNSSILTAPGVNGLAETLALTYNSLSAGAANLNANGGAGNGWELTPGGDMGLDLTTYSNGDIVYYDGTGKSWLFVWNGST